MTQPSPVLHGYHYSVYTRIARFALAEKGVAHDRREVNPFDPKLDPGYERLHPFRRVPVLEYGDLSIYETAAITQFVDEAFRGPSLQPTDAPARARMRQIIAVVDGYGYWPMVRQVFSQRVILPRMGRSTDESEIEAGLRASEQVLDALDNLIGIDGVLDGSSLSLADIHLAPMIDYFQQAPEGRAMLATRLRLSAWWGGIRARAAFSVTDPGLPGAA